MDDSEHSRNSQDSQDAQDAQDSQDAQDFQDAQDSISFVEHTGEQEGKKYRRTKQIHCQAHIDKEHSKGKKKVDEKEIPVSFQIGDHVAKLKQSRLKFYAESSKVEDDASLKNHASTPGLFSIDKFTGEAQKVHDTSLFINLTNRIVELEDEDPVVAVKGLKGTAPVRVKLKDTTIKKTETQKVPSVKTITTTSLIDVPMNAWKHAKSENEHSIALGQIVNVSRSAHVVRELLQKYGMRMIGFHGSILGDMITSMYSKVIPDVFHEGVIPANISKNPSNIFRARNLEACYHLEVLKTLKKQIAKMFG